MPTTSPSRSGWATTRPCALYKRFGLAPVGVRPNYYPETGEDALVMWARDIDSDEYAERLAAIEASLTGRSEVSRWW